MAASGKARHRNSTRKARPAMGPPPKTTADLFKEMLGWKPSTTPFHTTAKRECGGCTVIMPGSEFCACDETSLRSGDGHGPSCVPVTPGRPDLNVCLSCSAADTA
jgi:hypothetical protein